MIHQNLVERQEFDASYSESLSVISVDRTDVLSDSVLETFLTHYNRYGFAIFQLPEARSEQEHFLEFERYFGRPVRHNRSDDHDIVAVDASNPVTGYIGSTTAEHPLHHDGVFSRIPETVLTLKCIRPADFGGTSLLASGKAGYEFLMREMPEEVPHLMAPDAISMGRDGDSYVGPVFSIINGRMHFRFRLDTVAHIVPSRKALKAMDALRGFYRDPANFVQFDLKPGQMVVIDNRDGLHGRTPFSGPRRMLRRNYDGKGLLQQQLLAGFMPSRLPAQSRPLAPIWQPSYMPTTKVA